MSCCHLEWAVSQNSLHHRCRDLLIAKGIYDVGCDWHVDDQVSGKTGLER